MTNTNEMIVADGLKKAYRDIQAVDDLSFSVGSGNVLALLGPNGSGKTTIVKMLTTLLTIDEGQASVAGFNVVSQPHMVRQSIGLAGQSAAVDESLTGRENLQMFARLYHMTGKLAKQRTDQLLEEFRLTDFADRPVKTYSGGQRRRLDVVASLVADPLVLFLDEPTTGLDPRSRNQLWDSITTLAERGATVLLTTQYLEEADRLADSIVVINRGVVVASGTPDELKDRVGERFLDVTVASMPDLDSAKQVLKSLNYQVTEAPEDRLLRITAPAGMGSGIELLRILDSNGVAVVDFQFRRPTLDDVFLTVTEEDY